MDQQCREMYLRLLSPSSVQVDARLLLYLCKEQVQLISPFKNITLTCLCKRPKKPTQKERSGGKRRTLSKIPCVSNVQPLRVQSWINSRLGRVLHDPSGQQIQFDLRCNRYLHILTQHLSSERPINSSKIPFNHLQLANFLQSEHQPICHKPGRKPKPYHSRTFNRF